MNQWHIPRQKDERSRPARKGGRRLLKRMRRSELRLLTGELEAVAGAEALANRFRAMPDNERHGCGRNRIRGPQSMLDHRPSSH